MSELQSFTYPSIYLWDGDRWPMIFVLSLSENGAPHPLAQHPRLHGGCSLDTVTQDLLEEIAIVGDLIEWTIFGANTSMHVYNWKTGNIIWEDIECVSLSMC